MLRVFFSILIPLILGLPFSMWLESWLLRVAMAFLIGMVIISAGLIGVSTAGLGFGLRGVLPIAIVWLAAAAIVIKRSWASVQPRGSWPPRFGWPAWTLVALTALNVATAAGYALKTPIGDTDVVKIWLPKAQLLSTSGFASLAHSVYPDYPPLWPIHMYLAGTGSAWLKLLPSAYLLALLTIVFAYVSARVGPALGAACALAVSGVPYVWLPYGVNDLMSEIPTTAFVVASTIMLAEYVDQPSGARAAIAAASTIGAEWVRPEAFLHALLIAAVLVAVSLVRRRLNETILPAAAIVAAYIGWRLMVRFVFQYTGGLQPNPALLSPAVIASSFADTFRYAAANVGNPYLFGPALIAVACIALAVAHWRSFWVVGLVLVVDLGVGVATYIALQSTNVGEPLIWWLTTGFKRMVVHVIPLLYVAASLGVGSLIRSRTKARSAAPARIAAAAAITVIAIGMAAYAEFRVGGPKSFDLSDMGPGHVSGSSGRVDYPAPGIMSITTNGDIERITFYLLVTGRRLPPLDNISGTFTSFSSTVEASAPEYFAVSADGKPVAAVKLGAGGAMASLNGSIPLGTRLLELSAQPLGPGYATASWSHPTISRLTAWWLVDALLIGAMGLAAAWPLSATGLVKTRGPNLVTQLKANVVLVPLLAAAAAQQIEATLSVALPAWSYVGRLVHLL